MPGLTDWFDVFRCGTNRDSTGALCTVTRDDIDKAINKYEANSAPIVVGHPKTNAPAFGWIESFRRVGDLVQARCSKVVPEFVEAVKRGLYKNRSIAFNGDGTFRHVGFLGAAAPAIKGLEEIQFSDQGDYLTVELTDTAPETTTPETTAPQEEAPEAEIPNFKGTIEELTRKVEELEGKLSNEQAKRRRMEFAAYTDNLINAGRLKTSAKEQVLDMMEALYANDVATYADLSNSALTTFKGLLNDILPAKRVEFMEFASPARVHVQEICSEDLAKKARHMVEQNRLNGFYMTASEAVNRILGGKEDV